MKINVRRPSALTCGIVWGFGPFALTWWIIASRWQHSHATFLGQVYRGYNRKSPSGAGGIRSYGFFDALAAGAVTAWLYNTNAARSPRKRRPEGLASRMASRRGDVQYVRLLGQPRVPHLSRHVAVQAFHLVAIGLQQRLHFFCNHH